MPQRATGLMAGEAVNYAMRRREGFMTKRMCTPRRASMSIKASVLNMDDVG